MLLELRTPVMRWTTAATFLSLALLAGLWFGMEWLLEGPQEAREDWAEHVWIGAGWIVPSAAWLAWRRPPSRLHAFAVTMAWAAVVSTISLAFLLRFLAEDLGLPVRVSGILVAGIAMLVLLYQLLVSLAPAILLQRVMFVRAGASADVQDRRSSSPSALA